MSRFLLDTDHVTLHEQGDRRLRDHLARLEPRDLAVSVITVEEMVRGRLAVLRRRIDGEARIRAYAKFMETISFFGSIHVLPFDSECERTYQDLRDRRLRIGTQDLRIAATALANDAVVVTRNRRDFALVPALKLEDWTA